MLKASLPPPARRRRSASEPRESAGRSAPAARSRKRTPARIARSGDSYVSAHSPVKRRIMRRMRPGAAHGDHVRAGMASGTLAGRPAEAPAVLRRPLPVLLVYSPVLENQGALAARHRLAAAGTEHDA